MLANIFYGMVALALVFQVILLFWGDRIRKSIKIQGNFSTLGIVCNTLAIIAPMVILLGLFTSQSALFVVYILIVLICKGWDWSLITRGIMTITLLAFVLINKFQLHINFYQQIFNLFTQW